MVPRGRAAAALMDFERFLSAADAARVSLALEKLQHCGLREYALTGGIAMELQLATPRLRRLNDLDIVVASFDSIPSTVAGAFLLAHVHPRATDGKTLMQLVDAEQALRIDLFRECGATIERSRGGLVSLEDLAARAARVVLDLESGAQVERKHAESFVRLEPAVESELAEIAWREHRKDGSPATFRKAASRIRELLAERDHLLVSPDYSQDVSAVCAKCEDVGPFHCAPAASIRAILGYC